MRNWTPIFIENSRIPKLLSLFAPITIGAITMGFIVFSRGETDERTKRHETIHYQQFIETLFVGFLLIYAWDFLAGLARHRNGALAYRQIRAEKEAYANDAEEGYLESRKRWSWLFARKQKAEDNNQEGPQS